MAKRALTVDNILSKKRRLLPFDGVWLESLGTPELSGSWLVWGGSGMGKTTFVMQLSKYLTAFGRVCYNSLEEGDSETIKLALQRVEMMEVKSKFILLDREPIDELKERLRKHKAPQIVIIDSVQYSQMSYTDYVALKDEFRGTLFIIISHADGKMPEGRLAKKIRFDSNIKIRVEGYAAFVTSRYGGGKPYIIWAEKAEEYHGFDIINPE